MKTLRNKLCITILVAGSGLGLSSTSQAQVIVSFVETSDGVRVNWDGSIDITSSTLTKAAHAGDSVYLGNSLGVNQMLQTTDDLANGYGSAGTATNQFEANNDNLVFYSLLSHPLTNSTFGFEGDTLFIQADKDPSTLDPEIDDSPFVASLNFSSDWAYIDLVDVSMDDVHNRYSHGDILWTANVSGDVIIVGLSPDVVPEPSSSALLGLGALGLLVRRKR